MRGDPGASPARRGPGKFLASPLSAGPGVGAEGEGPRRRESLAGGRGPPGARGVTSCPR